MCVFFIILVCVDAMLCFEHDVRCACFHYCGLCVCVCIVFVWFVVIVVVLFVCVMVVLCAVCPFGMHVM